jgi:anti-anti-sigma factor
MTAMAVETGHVGCARLDDGVLVQLTGELCGEQLAEVRQVLLTPLAPGCRDVVVDAGGLTVVDAATLAVLIAAREWAEDQGVRFRLSRTSAALELALREHGLCEGLPRLTELPGAPRRPRVPRQRLVD